MKPIIEVRNLSKIYQIGAKSERYLSLRDRLSSPTQWFSSNKTEPFYALKDVSFDIMPGETVGIIGRNGAGKSTLLKILSRITPPTSGSIKLRGRVASLLEVGTGFHPELTGRENIFFNGAILGMRKSEINRKFDEIIDFSGVEQFLDTPLKQYSSGMQLRLAFAVAAHLEPEILLIDEVLAVGDAEFQKKCLGKMEDISKGQGRTVVVVSHDMGMVGRLCDVAVWIQNGRNVKFGKSLELLNEYVNQSVSNYYHKIKDSSIFLKYLSIHDFYNSSLDDYGGYKLVVKIISKRPQKDIYFAFGIQNPFNQRVALEIVKLKFLKSGENLLEITFSENNLLGGIYSIDYSILNNLKEVIDIGYNILSFKIFGPVNELILIEGADQGIIKLRIKEIRCS